MRLPVNDPMSNVCRIINGDGQHFNIIFQQGRQFPDANLPCVPADQTKAIFEAAIRALAQLQSLDTDQLTLEGIGDKEDVLKQRVGKTLKKSSPSRNAWTLEEGAC